MPYHVSWLVLLVLGTPALAQGGGVADSTAIACKSGVLCGRTCLPANTPCRLGVTRDTSAADTAIGRSANPRALSIPDSAGRKQIASPAGHLSGAYHRDSRGRCYTFNSRGRRVNVDRRLCD